MKPECDIILLSYESPDLLKKCVRSVLDHTRASSRLIIVDNASSDPEVRRYLQGIRGNDKVIMEKVFSEENVGFAGGMNRGMRLSEAPFVCLLNNDCQVTDGWLEEMIAVARSRDNIGLVNPQSNTFGSRPGIGNSIDDHAALIRNKKGRFTELGHAIGFACLIKREVIESIGYLDEAYRGFCYEDTDFSVRAGKNGFIAVMAEGAYVFHAEQASRGKWKGKEEIYRTNRKLFEDRWGRLLRIFFLDRLPGSDERVSEYYEILKGMARERAIIDMWSRGRRSSGGNLTGFDGKKPIKHADIGVNIFLNTFTAPAVLWQVLTKKKKYDAIIMKDGPLLRFLGFLKPLHGAETFSLKEKTRIETGKRMTFDLETPGPLAEYLRRAK